MFANRGFMAKAGAALVATSMLCAPLAAASPKFSVRTKATAPSIPMATSIGSFTPAAADARRSLSFGRAGLGDSGFRFTPSAAPGSRRNVTVAIRARATTAAQAERAGQASAVSALAPTAYNLGVAIGWRRFALTGDVSRVQGGLLPLDREVADVGLTYSGNKWSTRLQLGAERAIGSRIHLLGADEAYSVDLGGSYSLTGNLQVTGGVRYKMQRDRIDTMLDDRQDSQAVYIGTAFRF